MLTRVLAVGLVLFASGCNWPIDVRAVMTDGETFTGTVIGGTLHGSMNLTNGKGVDCVGEYYAGVGFLNCNNGEQAQIRYSTVSIGAGYGFGTTSNGRGLRFTFGMSPERGAVYLGPPVAATGGGGGTPASTGARSSGTGFFITRQGHVLNFAIKADVVRTFLSTSGISMESSAGGRELNLPDIGDKARAFTVHVECK
jgi:hypothetical protein